jgi:rhodanese-related sulfurtransferase
MKSRIAIASWLFALCSIVLPAQSAEITKESLATLRSKIAEKEAVLVDVREKSEWDDGHVEGATPLPLSALKERVDPAALSKVPPRDKVSYTHCVVGKRSLTAANILEKLGYDVRSLKPGYKELIEAGFKQAQD